MNKYENKNNRQQCSIYNLPTLSRMTYAQRWQFTWIKSPEIAYMFPLKLPRLNFC